MAVFDELRLLSSYLKEQFGDVAVPSHVQDALLQREEKESRDGVLQETETETGDSCYYN